jgi:hypothetical protein
MDDDDFIFESFQLPVEGDPADPRPLFDELIELEEHVHFKEYSIRVGFLLRVEAKVKAGRHVLGQAMLPTVQGELKPLFEQLLFQWLGRPVQFLIILDRDYWLEADDITRMALLEHEMMHIKQELNKEGDLKFDRDGNPCFGLVGHDLEEFNYIVRKYGSWKGDISSFLAAASEHN